MDKERALGLEEEEKESVSGIPHRPTHTQKDLFYFITDSLFKENIKHHLTRNVHSGWKRKRRNLLQVS